MTRKLLWLTTLTCLLTTAAPWLARAHTSETIETLSVTNFTGDVIASDAANNNTGYNRDAIRGRAAVRYFTSSLVTTTYQYQLVYRLLDSNNLPVTLITGFLQTNSAVVSNYNITLPFGGPGGATNIVLTNTFDLKPASQLDPFNNYRVELKLYERPFGSTNAHVFTGDEALTPSSFYTHYTNLVTDSAQNVIAKLNSAAFARSYAVKTIPGKKSFQVQANYNLRRYDNFDEAPVATPQLVRFNYQLIDVTTGQPLPLTTNQAVFVHDVPTYAINGNLKVPANLFFSDTLELEPAANLQLDSVGTTYRAVVAISHMESFGVFQTGNQRATPDTRLLHFNGHLFFGNVDTIFESINNSPLPISFPPSAVRTDLEVASLGGYLVSSPTHKYGDGSALSVDLRTDGTAHYMGASGVAVPVPSPDNDNLNGIRFARTSLKLDKQGAVANIVAWYPTGFGTRPNINTYGRFLITPATAFLNVRLTPGLDPVSDLTGPAGWGSEETKPFWFEFSSQTWELANGRFVFQHTGAIKYTRAAEQDVLANAPVLPLMKRKPSNESHLSAVQNVTGSPVVVDTDPQRNSARLFMDVQFAPGKAITHFPYDSSLQWSNTTTVSISNDLFTVQQSVLAGVSNLNVGYTRDCTEPDCQGGQGIDTLNFRATNNTLFFTRDGGLTAKGEITTPKELTWGWIQSLGKYTHRVEAFTPAGFHMPGFFLRGGETTHDETNRPAVILYTGIGSNSPTHVDFNRIERPYTPAYLNATNGGFGDYAGVNFRVVTDSNKDAESTLAGDPTGDYPLTGRSKYYVRKGGINGIHEAVFGSFPPTNKWYGYSFQVSNFGLSFLNSQVHDSRTEGSVFVKSPSVVTQNFEKLMFNCLGGLTDAQVPQAEQNLYKELHYWQADFVTLGIRFDRKDGLDCDPGEGKLVLGVRAHAQPFPDSLLFGELGFETNGNLITKADNVLPDNFDSRLKLPTHLSFPGPNGEKWHFTPVNDAYFNNYNERVNGAGAPDVGWLNIAGKLDAPFYEDLKVHMHCSADKDEDTSPIYLMGGWPAKGFEWSAGKNFFTENPSDPDNLGFPKGQANIQAYRQGNLQTTNWFVRAQREWLDVVEFDYPLFWEPIPRAFRSAMEMMNKLLVLEVKHQVKYLSPENADITFGAQYTGVPQLNIANLAYDQLGGLKNALDEAISAPSRAVLDAGMERLEEALSASARDLFRPALNSIVRPQVQTLVTTLSNNYHNAAWPNLGYAISQIKDAAVGASMNSISNKFRFNFASPGGSGATNLAATLHASLGQVDSALAVMEDILHKDPNTEVRNMIANIMQKIVGQVAADFAGYFVPAEVNDVLKQFNPTLDQLLAAATTLRGSINDVRQALVAGNQFQSQLQNLFQNQAGVIGQFMDKAIKDCTNVLAQFDLGPGDSPFAQYNVPELTDLFMQKIEDRFFGSMVSSAVRETLKHRIYDLDASIRQVTDSAFQQVNVAVRDIISEAAQQLSNEITPMLGALDSFAGAGKLNGYAHINGDDLKELRIDAYAQLKVPSEMEFHGWLLIRELDSENFPTACLPAGGKATEVSLGADNIPVKFASTDARLAAQAKFTFLPSDMSLLGMAGGIDLDGKLVLGPATIKKLSAAMAFGTEENYFSAAARVALNSYEGFGGIYFGRTCTLDPFSWDPEAQKILGQPPFTGAYGYVEVWIPVSEALLGIPATCMFQVSAGMGMGAGYFVEGPTFIGKAMLGVSGDFLCVASISGDIKLAGKKGSDGLRMLGSGTFEVELCALVCISASKTVEIQYQNGSWDIDF